MMATVYFRTLIIYVVLFAAMRLMGKRQVGELQVSELIVTFMLSEFAIIPMQDTAIPVSYAIIPIFLLLSLEVINSFILTKSSVLRKLFCGRPSVVVLRGKLLQGELKRLRITLSELLSELRQKNITDISDVEYAIIEENGKLSVCLKSEKRPATLSDIGKSSVETGLAHAIIVDGEINQTSLSISGKDDDWLEHELKKSSVRVEEIFFLSVNDSGDVNMIRKDK